MLRYILAAALCLLALPAFALNVRVQPTPGGPQICVDGKPIPPRFFWGSMNSGRLVVKPEWTQQSFEFLPGEVNGTGTLHFRFASTPAEIWVADLRLQDAKTGEDVLPEGSFATPEGFKRTWNTWPLLPANTVGKTEVAEGALHITLANPPDGGNWPDFHLHSNANLSFAAGRTYRCTFRSRASAEVELRPQVYTIDPILGAGASPGGIAVSFDDRSRYFGNLDDHHLVFSRGNAVFAPMSPAGRFASPAKPFAFQSCFEEASGQLDAYSSFWSDVEVSGLY